MSPRSGPAAPVNPVFTGPAVSSDRLDSHPGTAPRGTVRVAPFSKGADPMDDATGHPDAPLLAHERIDELRRELGPEVLGELLASIRAEVAAVRAPLEAAAAHDAGAAETLLHALKGASSGVGLAALAEAAGGLELAARAGHPPGAENVARLLALAERSLAALASETGAGG